MDRKSRRKPPSRRKRIQLDDSVGRKSPDKEPATSVSAGNDQSSSSQTGRKRHASSSTAQAGASELDKIPLPGSPPRLTQGSPPRLPLGTPPKSPRGSPSRTGASSPEPNCAICLGKLENKSFTDSCFHQFCYVCLLEWSKVKAECPLCKQTFKSIIHNIRSNEDYDQYHIPRAEERDPFADLFAPGGRRFRYRTTVTDHRYYGNQALDSIQRRMQQLLEDSRLERPSRRRHYPASNHRAWRTLRQAASSSFRRGIYLNGLKAKEPTTTRRRFRETAPEFFRDNDACTHRLVPWLNRELNAVLEGREDHVAYVMDLIMGLIKRYNIDSEEFYQHVYAFIGRHTRHFMHEFLMFAKSPYHMAAYDQHVTYEPSTDYVNEQSETETIHHTDDNGSDVEIVDTEPARDNHPARLAVENAPPRVQALDTNLLSWESSVISMAQPNYSYFNPVVQSTQVYTPQASGLRSRYQGRSSTYGWDSPTPGPSWSFGSPDSLDTTSDIDILNIVNPFSSIGSSTATSTLSSISSTQPLDLSNSAGTSLINGGASQNPDFYNSFFDSLNLRITANGTDQNPNQERTVETTSKLNPVVCSDTDSDDAVEIVDYEKPWLERSPIHLSTDNSSDCEIMITGTSNMGPDQRVKKKKTTSERSVSDILNEVVVETTPEEKRGKKRKHRSGSKTLPRQYKERHYSHSSGDETSTRSRSPLRLRFNVPQYKDKFSKHYRKEKDREKSKDSSERRRRDSHRSNSHSSSRSKRYRNRSSSTSSSDGEHVSYRSHKHKSRSGMEIMEYFKKSVKRKKSKKKHRSSSPSGLSELYHHKKKKKSKDRRSSKDRDKSRKHKHKQDRSLDKSLTRNFLSSTNAPVETHLNISELHASLDVVRPKLSFLVDKARKGVENSVNNVSNKSSLSEQNDNTSKSVEIGEKDKECDQKNQKDIDTSTKDKSVNEILLGTSSNLEFTEMLPSQTGMIDKDLESLADLFPDFTKASNSNDSLRLSFKKHPHGHKKSSTSGPGSITGIQTSVINFSNERTRNISETIPNPDTLNTSEKHLNTDSKENNDIQPNTITSCTNLQTGSLMEDLNKSPNETLNQLPNNEGSNISDEILKNLSIISSLTDINASVPATVFESLHSDSDTIDVEAGSGDSDIDVLKIDEDCSPSKIAGPNASLTIDVDNAGNVSDSNTDITIAADDEVHLDVEALSDSETDTVKYVGVELIGNHHEDEREVDITGVSDTETVTYLSEGNNAEIDSGSEIDVLEVSNEDVDFEGVKNICGKRLSRSSKTLCLDSDSEGIDLDYQYEHSEETDKTAEQNTDSNSMNYMLDKLRKKCEESLDRSRKHKEIVRKVPVGGENSADNDHMDKYGNCSNKVSEECEESMNKFFSEMTESVNELNKEYDGSLTKLSDDFIASMNTLPSKSFAESVSTLTQESEESLNKLSEEFFQGINKLPSNSYHDSIKKPSNTAKTVEQTETCRIRSEADDQMGASSVIGHSSHVERPINDQADEITESETDEDTRAKSDEETAVTSETTEESGDSDS